MITINRLSTMYVPVPVTVTIAGAAYNPTSDPVVMAFMRGDALPGSGDWHPAIWETANGTYNALCLVGPAGGIVLAPGYWDTYVKVTDSPEVPVLPGPQLSIT